MILIITFVLGAAAPVSEPSSLPHKDPQIAADILIAEAEADPARADDKLAMARMLAPNDPEVYFASARFALVAGKREGALLFLERTIALDHEHPQAVYMRAVLLFAMGKDEAALAAFKDVKARFPADERADYYLGVLAKRSGNHEGALTSFDLASKGKSEEAKLAAVERELLLQELGRGNDEGLSRTVAALPDGRMKSAMSQLVEAKQGDKYKLPWLYARLELITEFDSNASLGAAYAAQVNETLAALASPTTLLPTERMAARMTELIRVGGRPVAKDIITVEADLTFVNANHLNDRVNLAVYDYGGVTAAARAASVVGGGATKGNFGLELNVRDIWTGGYTAHLLTAFSIQPYVGALFTKKRAFYAFANMELRDFIAGNAPVNDANDRDGWHFAAGIMPTFAVGKTDVGISFSYLQDVMNGNGQLGTAYRSNFAARGGRFGLTVRYTWQDRVVLNLGFNGSVRYFEQADPVRLEVRYEPYGSLHIYFLRYAGVGITYNYTHNDAYQFPGARRYDPMVYRRHVAGLSLIGHY